MIFSKDPKYVSTNQSKNLHCDTNSHMMNKTKFESLVELDSQEAQGKIGEKILVLNYLQHEQCKPIWNPNNKHAQCYWSLYKQTNNEEYFVCA